MYDPPLQSYNAAGACSEEIESAKREEVSKPRKSVEDSAQLTNCWF